MANNVKITLLQIAQVMSMSDGSISEAEQQLLAELPKRVLKMYQRWETCIELISHRPTARVACLIAGVSRNPGDDHDFNQDERSAYRELITTLNLSEQELRDIEWAAHEDETGQIIGAADSRHTVRNWRVAEPFTLGSGNSRPRKRNQNNQYRTLSSHVLGKIG